MEKIAIISDDACDLNKEEVKENMKVVSFYVIDAKSGAEQKLTVDEVYDNLNADSSLRYKTSCPSVEDYSKAFEQFIKKNMSVICVCISSKFSGSFSSASVARNAVIEKYPDAKISIVDSTYNSALQGMLVLSVYDMVKAGLTHQQILDKIPQLDANAKIMFTVADIDYLRKGGRIGLLKSFVASTLNLKPIIQMKEGELHSGGVGMGMRKTVQKIIEQMKKHFANSSERKEEYMYTVGYSSSIDEGKKLITQCATELGLNEKFFRLARIGSTTAVHTGPHTIGVSFLKKWNHVKQIEG